MQRKWIVLSQTLTTTGVYHTARTTARRLSSRYYAGKAVIRESAKEVGDRTIEAYAASWATMLPDWYEIGTVWIVDRLRSNGLARQLMMEIIQLVSRDDRFFLITREATIMKLALELGFVPVTTRTHPDILQWASKIGIVARLPASVHPIAPNTWARPQAGERWLFVRDANSSAR